MKMKLKLSSFPERALQHGDTHDAVYVFRRLLRLVRHHSVSDALECREPFLLHSFIFVCLYDGLFCRPFSALMVLVLATVTGFCGCLVTGFPASALIFRPGFCCGGVAGQRLVEIKTTEIHGMGKNLSGDLAGAEYSRKKNLKNSARVLFRE